MLIKILLTNKKDFQNIYICIYIRGLFGKSEIFSSQINPAALKIEVRRRRMKTVNLPSNGQRSRSWIDLLPIHGSRSLPRRTCWFHGFDFRSDPEHKFKWMVCLTSYFVIYHIVDFLLIYKYWWWRIYSLLNTHLCIDGEAMVWHGVTVWHTKMQWSRFIVEKQNLVETIKAWPV